MATKTYVLHVEGAVPGLPGIWPAGSVVVVDEDPQTGRVTLVSNDDEKKIEELEAQIEEVEQHYGQ